MKFLIPLAVAFAAVVALPTSDLLADNWVSFKATHGKNYATLDEELLRLSIFKDNLKKIEEHNALYDAGKSTFTMGVNKFADWTAEEFQTYINKNKLKKPTKSGNREVFDVSDSRVIAASVDWRGSGLITAVKDQGSCGSCWAFSTTGALEAAYKNKSGTLLSFSEQQLVDCTTGKYGNEGCNGGWMDWAFDFIKDSGVVEESDYQYTGRDGKCSFNASQVVTKIRSYVDIVQNDTALAAAIQDVGPIAVAIDASFKLQLYSSGILDDNICGNTEDDINHAILAVGYSSENGVDYWILKNSWGAFWGESGYFRLTRKRNNECGINLHASYPVI